MVDVKETCGEEFTLTIDGHEVRYSGLGDLHETKYEDLAVAHPFATFAKYDYEKVRQRRRPASLHFLAHDLITFLHRFQRSSIQATSGEHKHCAYSILTYPSTEFEDSFHTSQPYLFAMGVLIIFLLTAGVFAFYDFLVQRRQNKVLRVAKRTTAMVTSLFPKQVTIL